jgi:hypothetical protein
MQEVPKRHEQNKYRPQHLYEFSRRYRELLQATHPGPQQGLPALLQELSKLLRAIFEFHFIAYALHDSDASVMQHYILDEGFGLPDYPFEIAVDGSPAGWVWSRQLPLALYDLTDEEHSAFSLEPYQSKGVRSLILLRLTSQGKKLGVIGFGKSEPAHYDNGTVPFLEQVSGLEH